MCVDTLFVCVYVSHKPDILKPNYVFCGNSIFCNRVDKKEIWLEEIVGHCNRYSWRGIVLASITVPKLLGLQVSPQCMHHRTFCMTMYINTLLI